MIVLDASVLIAHLDRGDALHQQAETLLTSAPDEALGASPLTLAEVLVEPARAGRLEAAAAALHQLGVAAIPLAEDSPRQLAALRAETGRRLPDCCVLLAAGQTGGEVATFDHALASAARSLGVEVRGTTSPSPPERKRPGHERGK